MNISTLRPRALAALTLLGLAMTGTAEARTDAGALQTGVASWYATGRVTASGERFNPGGMTAAHRTLPFGTRVRVVHAASGRSVVVRINDRGPFHGGRVIDLARGASRALGVAGVAKVALYRLD